MAAPVTAFNLPLHQAHKGVLVLINTHPLPQGITLQPGDIIATGTPAGVGIGHVPPVCLGNGDVAHSEIDGIGTP